MPISHHALTTTCGIHYKVQFNANQLTQPGPLVEFYMGSAESTGLHETIQNTRFISIYICIFIQCTRGSFFTSILLKLKSFKWSWSKTDILCCKYHLPVSSSVKLCLLSEFLASVWGRHLNTKFHMNIITLQDESLQDTTKLEKLSDKLSLFLRK